MFVEKLPDSMSLELLQDVHSCLCFCLCVATPLVCVCFLFTCVLRVLPLRPVRTLRWSEAFLSLTIAGSRQHVAVIRPKEIGEREREREGERDEEKKPVLALERKMEANETSVEETCKEPSPVE